MPTPRIIIAISLLAAILCSCRHKTETGTYGMETVISEQRDGYACHLIEFDTEPGERIHGYLLVPDRASATCKVPAVVMLHDHGARFDIGKEKLVRPIQAETASCTVPGHIAKSAEQWAGKYFDGIFFGDLLASEGFAVIVADALYWGERSSPEAREWSRLTFGDTSGPERKDSLKQKIRNLKQTVYEGQRDVYAGFEDKGDCWAEKILRDDIATAGLISSMPFVDTSRVHAFGFSMGAHRCWLLSAFCDRIKRGAAVCWMTEKQSYDSDNASDLSMRIPSMRDTMDFPDIARLTRPKPMLFINGAEDPLFPKETVRKAFNRMQAEYSGCPPGTLRTYFVPGGHHCGTAVQDSVLQFFSDIAVRRK